MVAKFAYCAIIKEKGGFTMKKSIFYDHIEVAARQTGRSVESVLAEAKELGFDGVECGDVHFEGKREEFKAMLEKTGMAVASVYKFFDFARRTDPDEIEQYLDDVVFLGAEKTLIIPGYYTGTSDRGKEFADMVAAMKLICAGAAARGLTVTLEDYDDAGTPCTSMAELRSFLDELPEVRFTFDTGNFRRSCEDVMEGYALLKDRLNHVHLKDRVFAPLTEGDKGLTADDGAVLYPAPVGGGVFPIRECIEAVLAEGYDGWFSAEHFNSADMMGYIRRSAEFLAAF